VPGPAIVFDLRPAHWTPSQASLEDLCRQAIAATAGAVKPLDFASWEVGITITDDAEIRALNRDHRGQDRPTNVLSFPLDRPGLTATGSVGGLLGDVVLSDETVLREAARDERLPADHLTHLVVHGMLHLLGYDHEVSSQAEEMEALEITILAGLGIANPYAAPQMADTSARENLEPLGTDHA